MNKELKTKDLLLSEFRLSNSLALKNRIVMAPMSRSMASDELVPTAVMADYYARRADVGLIISEATVIAPLGQGYPNTPGLFTAEQVTGWQQVTQKVHENGGKIFAQIWHAGRVSHPVYLKGEKPIAPSAVGLHGRVPRAEGLEYGMPREMSETEIKQLVKDFAAAAANARQAGFDGVELHGANGYLLDQFLHWDTNRRTDGWGGSRENMSRLLFEVVDAVKQEVDHVGLRLSPVAYLHLEHDVRDREVFDYLLEQLNGFDLAYIHTGMSEDNYQSHLDGTVTQYIRSLYRGRVIANGGYDADSGRQVLRDGDADMIAIGRPLIANPDYVEKVREKQVLTEYTAAHLESLL